LMKKMVQKVINDQFIWYYCNLGKSYKVSVRMILL
jgi:hypothetical protein